MNSIATAASLVTSASAASASLTFDTHPDRYAHWKLSFEGETATLAMDVNAGVREISWMAVRQDIERELAPAIRLLSAWTQASNDNLRRFASEATRPRGVWCKHLNPLKENPALGLPILERFCKAVEMYNFPQVGKKTVSIGVVQMVAGELPSTLLDKADKALYYAKQHGRNRVCAYEHLVASGQLQENNVSSGDVELF